jgi:NADH oxidase (H2O-forming)
MDRQLDEKGSELFRDLVIKAGVALSLGQAPEKITGDEKVSGVLLSDGTVTRAQMVILSTGVKANLDLAKAAGIETDRFIKVNERMETSIPGIYACGDCASFNGISIGIWSQAVEMGKVAGACAAGEEMVYVPIIPSNAFNGMGTALFSVGDPGRVPENKYKSIEVLDAGKGTYEKMYFVNNRFCGGVLLGDVSKATKFIEAYKNQESIEKIL